MTWAPWHELFRKGNDWFDLLPREVSAAVLARCRRRTCPRGEMLYERGDTPDGMYYIIEGCIQARGRTANGRPNIIDFFGSGTWIGETGVLAEMPRVYDLLAYDRSMVYHLELPAMDELMRAYPALARGLLQLEARRIALLVATLECYTAHSMQQRLANRLMMLVLGFGRTQPDGSGVELELRLPQQTLAEMVGTTRQRVNQIIREWEREEILDHHNGRVLIRRPAVLSEMIAPQGTG